MIDVKITQSEIEAGIAEMVVEQTYKKPLLCNLEYQIIKQARESGVYWKNISSILNKFGFGSMPKETMRGRFNQETIRREKEGAI